MLNLLESWLEKAVRPVLPTDLPLIVGPILPPAVTDTPLVNVAVTRLRPLRKSRSDEEDRLDTAQVTRAMTLTGDGERTDFELEKGTAKKIVEIETSPGHLARPGDDYRIQVDAKTEEELLRFYRPPTGEFTVLLKLDAAARGYQQRSPCRATIEVTAWADQISKTGDLLTQTVAAVLASLAGIDRLDLARCDEPGFSLRLLNPRAALSAVERVRMAGEEQIFRSTASLSLRGEWELTLALGMAPAEGRIDKVIPSVAVLGSSD